MPERSSKRNARRESITSSVDEPECLSMRTGNVPSNSDKDFADLTEKIEKSVNKRTEDTETGQREVLKMIENLSSEIDSLTDKTSCDLNQGLNGVNSENVILENRPIELNEFQQDVSQHSMNFRENHLCLTLKGIQSLLRLPKPKVLLLDNAKPEILTKPDLSLAFSTINCS